MVEKKAELKQQEAALKGAEKTRMAAPKCATEKTIWHFYRTKSINVHVSQFKEQQTVEKQTAELTTFRPQAS